ncbi:hypothetical protein [Streptomyces griseofuscus]|uniref:hypothetical protein n=1 Tax=Streptomyces griseofuscus TaxID=146922 RepID=UPI00369577E4
MTEIDLYAIDATIATYRKSHDHPSAFACCSAHPAADAAEKLVAENRRLRAQVEQLDRMLSETIDDRDRIHDMADKLAYAVAPEEVIGEHSSMNCPWENALDLITPMAEVDKLRAQLDATARLAGRLETKLRNLGAPATADAVETHVVADDSDDPEHTDNCPGCEPASVVRSDAV